MMSLGAFLGTVLSYFFVKNYWKVTYKLRVGMGEKTVSLR
jgi:hypothetical protein